MRADRVSAADAANAWSAWVAVIGALPQVLALLVLVVLGYVKRAQLGAILARISSVKVAGVELSLSVAELRDAKPGKLDHKSADRLQTRLEAMRPLLLGRRVLWVDDHPANNAPERRLLRKAGLDVVSTLSTQEGLEELRRDTFDVAITNGKRDNNSDAGAAFARAARAVAPRLPVLAYVGTMEPQRPVPACFAAITDQPAEIIQLVLDRLERVP